MSERQRLDRLLVARGLAPTRGKAQALVMAGRVHSEGETLDKPGARLPLDAPLSVEPGPRWVGRGGEKLAGALSDFGVVVDGRDALDVGASTGGFTQVLLERGARRVVALDVGRGQLDWSLRKDPRVHPLEGVNARYLDPSSLPFSPQVLVVDVSFISLRLVLPAVVPALRPEGEALVLIKPQFEAGREQVPRGGVIRDPEVRFQVLERIVAFALERDWGVRGVRASRIRGAEGNHEYFVQLKPLAPSLSRERLSATIRALAHSVEAT